MKTLFLTVASLFILNGCWTNITVPVNPKIINEETATIIIYMDFIPRDEGFSIIMDGELVGYVARETPLVIEAAPGFHEIHTKNNPGIIDRITNLQVEANKIYFLRLWAQFGTWVTSFWLSPSEPITEYTIRRY